MIETAPILRFVITVIEFAGFGVIAGGMAGSSIWILYKGFSGAIGWEDAYFRLRRGNGRSLVLGLELLVAAEIIRSITTETLESILLLAAVVVIRTFLAITVEMETEGHWPWERRKHRALGESNGEATPE